VSKKSVVSDTSAPEVEKKMRKVLKGGVKYMAPKRGSFDEPSFGACQREKNRGSTIHPGKGEGGGLWSLIVEGEDTGHSQKGSA